ncbi:MAG: hypothetical protein ACREP8_01610 [Candidatus Binatia bacterium]
MKITNFLLCLFLVGGLAACSQAQPTSRDHIAANLSPILKIERRADRVKYYARVLGFTGGNGDDKGEKLRAHYDVYYVYYLAATFNLARGNMDAYLASVKSATVELDAMETILRDKIGSKLQDMDSEKENRISRSAF